MTVDEAARRTTLHAAADYTRAISDAIVETVCYVVLIGIALYFSVLSPTGYEPDRAILVRTLAIVGGGAWLISTSLGQRTRANRTLILLATVLFIAYAIGTIFSIDPRESFWGSHGRQEGLVSHASYLIFLVLFATRFASSAARNRLVNALLIGSVPVVFYGFLQRFGYDPVPSGGDPNTLYWPVRGSFGQHIFFGSYLVMVAPFTALRLVTSLRGGVRRPLLTSEVMFGGGIVALSAVVYIWFMILGVRWPAMFALLPALLAGFALVVETLSSLPRTEALEAIAPYTYGLLLLVQIGDLFFTGARGAWLAFFAEAPVFVGLYAWRERRTRLWQSTLVLSVIGGAFLLLLNIPEGPLQPLRTVSGLSRLANITESGGAGGSAQGRLLIWQGVTDLMTRTPPIGGHFGGPVRALIGYGPESMHWAFERVFPLKLRIVTSEIWTWDRAHNIYLDTLVDAGLVGLLAQLALLGVALLQAIRRVAAQPLMVAAAAALVAHGVDGIFGLNTAVTFVLVALCIGLISAPDETGQQGVTHGLEEAASPGGQLVPRWQVGVAFWGALLVALALVAAAPVGGIPALASGLWLVGLLAGIGACAAMMSGRVVPARPSFSLTVIVLLCALALGSQFAVVRAEVAERTGTDRLATGDVSGAITALQTAVRANPYDPQPNTELGGAYLSLAAQRSDSADPAYIPGPYDFRSLSSGELSILGQQQLLQLSAEALQEARALSPLDPDVYNNLGNLYSQWNKPRLALGAYRHAEQLSHQNPKYLDQQALVLLGLGHAGRAWSLAERAHHLDSTYWFSYYCLALIAHQTGDATAAEHNAQQALAWVRNFWPPPPQQQIATLQAMAQTG